VADKSITRRVYCNYVDAGISEKLAVMPILDRSIYHTGIDNRYEQGGNVRIAGIDPGQTGAIAIMERDGTLVNVYDMPVLSDGKRKIVDGHEVLRILDNEDVDTVYLEKAQTMPGQGISSSGHYMKGAGIIEGIIIALGTAYELIHPATWKRAVMRDMPKEKEASVIKVRQLYPDYEGLTHKKHHGRADAILIAYYGVKWEKWGES
jgi:crossover junction endodeoxyribonuclease RuvC